MAKKNYYAVKKGRKPGIYKTWAQCSAQTAGFSGAVFKGFETLNQAETYMSIDNTPPKTNTKNKENESTLPVAETQAVAYVDGSFDIRTHRFSCGVVMFYNGKEEHFSQSFDDAQLATMRNVAGELKGSEKAITYCLENNIKSIEIHHDYEGIARWCTGEWQAKKPGTIAYKSFYDQASKSVDIYFVKVKGHSGDKYNDVADLLAKKALGIN